MSRPTLEVADIVRAAGNRFWEHHGSRLAWQHLLPSVRGDLLVKLGRYAEAREEFQRAIAMTGNRREHELLTAKLKQTVGGVMLPVSATECCRIEE